MMMALEADVYKRQAQHGVGCRDVAALQRGADAGGGHRLFLKLCHGHHHHFHAQRSAQLAQQLRRTGSLGPEGEVLAAEQGFCMAVFHDAAHELFRAEALDLLKVRREVILHAQAGDQRVLVRRGQQALALHFVVHRQPEGKHRRGSPVGSGPLHRTVDDGPVADVDAVEVAHGQDVYKRQLAYFAPKPPILATDIIRRRQIL